MNGVDPEEFPDKTGPLAGDGNRDIAWEDDDYPPG